jgi:beta-galactosidase
MPALMICMAVALAGAWPSEAATNAQEVEESCSLQSDLVTPHKPWGRGYVGGPVRTLFFIYTGAYAGEWEDARSSVREVVEFGERFDLRADAVLVCGKGEGPWGFHGVKLGEQRAQRLLKKPYQLYVIAGFPMGKLPAEMQYLILKEVAEGAGLLCCGPGASDYMVPRRQVDPTPAFLTAGIPQLDDKPVAEVVSAYNLGEGRGVRLNYSTRSIVAAQGFSRREMNVYDYRMLLIGRAALWAAGRDGAITVDEMFDDEPLVINWADGGATGEMSLSSGAAEAIEATVALELRRVADGMKTSLGEQTVTLQPGQTTRMRVGLPQYRAGDYLVDAIVKSKRGVEAFGAGALTVESDFGVEEVALDASFVEVGDSISGAVKLRGDVPAGSVLRMSLFDSYDRIVRQEDLAIAAEVPFEYEADGFWTNLMRVEATVVVGGAEIEMKDASFSVPKRRHDEFTFVMWDAPMDALGPYAWRQMQEAGYNVCLMGSMGNTPRSTPALAACDASVAPYSTRILDPKDEQGFMQPVCWNDEAAVTEYVQGIVDRQQLLREQGVFVYSLGDEGVTKGCCVHPACLDAYRDYLAAQYGTIDALNDSWGAEYGSFDEVDLLDHNDNMENAAKKTNFPRWYDRQAFARKNLMQFVGRFGEAYSRLDPLAKTGFEGTGRFGDDYDAILEINDFYGPYPSIGDDIIRSAARPEMVSSNWMGYSKTGDALSDAAWRMVMKGKNSIWYWMWSGIGSYIGYLRPTFDEWPAIADLTEEMRPVREGLGDLLMRSEMAHSGIGVFYSVPSALAGDLEVNGFIKPVSTHEIWAQLTYELGLDFRYVTSGMLLDGVLSTDEFRVLLLPMSQAISPEEAALIRDFAEQGGTVIADVRPGIYDGHCKPTTPGLLDDMFGIARTGSEDAVEATVALSGSLDGRDLDLQLDKVKLDAGVEADAAEALGGGGDRPAFLVNEVGEGRAILLNFQLASSSDSEPQTSVARKLLALLYDVAGAKSAVTVAAPDGAPLPATETRVWENGDALVFGMWRQMPNAWFNPKGDTSAGKPAPARITLPESAHVYDLRAGRYLGSVERVNTRLRWGRASFFLALPYKIEGLSVTAAPASPDADEVVTASINLALPNRAEERFAVYTEVVDPNGNRPLWGRRVVVLTEGAGQVQVRVAHNDAPGRWRVVATELFSGQSAEASWTVQ